MALPPSRFLLIAALLIVLIVFARFRFNTGGERALSYSESYIFEHRLTKAEAAIYLAQRGDVNGVKDAIGDGVSINVIGRDGESILSSALQTDHNPVVEYTLSAGFSPSLNCVGPDGQPGNVGDTALYWAARTGRIDIVKKLLRLGSPADGARWLGLIPIQAACEFSHPEIVTLLVKYGAKFQGPFNYEGRHSASVGLIAGPLMIIPAINRDDEMLRTLIKVGAPTIGDTTEAYPLQLAVTEDWVEGVTLLLAAGSDPTVKNQQKQTLDQQAQSEQVAKLIREYREIWQRAPSPPPIKKDESKKTSL